MIESFDVLFGHRLSNWSTVKLIDAQKSKMQKSQLVDWTYVNQVLQSWLSILDPNPT